MPKSYYITSPRYIRQAGQSEPQYVPASPENPVKVTLDDDQEPGFVETKGPGGQVIKKMAKGWHSAEKAPPAPPKPAHAGGKGGLPKSHEVGKLETGGRAADK